jgi:hypothetical protein
VTIPEIFSMLLDGERVVIACSPEQGESLRIQLVKRWSKYKRELDAVGFLGADKAELVCSCTRDATSGTTAYLLRKTVRQPLQFTIIPSE